MERAGFRCSDRNTMLGYYDAGNLKPGCNRVKDEDNFFIANPGLELWEERIKVVGR